MNEAYGTARRLLPDTEMQDCIIYRHSQLSEYETPFTIDKEEDNLYERIDEARIKEILEQGEVIHNLHADETSNAIYMSVEDRDVEKPTNVDDNNEEHNLECSKKEIDGNNEDDDYQT